MTVYWHADIRRFRDGRGRFIRPPLSLLRTGRDSAGRFIPKRLRKPAKRKISKKPEKTPLEFIPYSELKTDQPRPEMKSRAGDIDQYGVLAPTDYDDNEDPYPEAQGGATLGDHRLYLKRREKRITSYKFAYSGKKSDVEKRRIKKIEAVYLLYNSDRGYHYRHYDYSRSNKRAYTPKRWSKELRGRYHDIFVEKIIGGTGTKFVELVYFREYTAPNANR